MFMNGRVERGGIRVLYCEEAFANIPTWDRDIDAFPITAPGHPRISRAR